MTDNDAVQLLIDAGFTNGWAISDGVLVLWEHDKNPPAPLKKPTELQETAQNDNSKPA
jgi:hypothetical protein